MSLRRLAACGFLLVACFSCGRPTVDLKAHVTLDGVPLEGASVTLIGTNGTNSRPAAGITNAAGDVVFTTFQPDDGVLPGEYKVLISKTPKSMQEEFARLDPNDPDDVARMQARERGAVNVPYTPTALPKIYLNAAETPLSVKVPPDKQPVVFDLNSSLGKRKP